VATPPSPRRRRTGRAGHAQRRPVPTRPASTSATAASAPVFGWPQAFVLAFLTPASFTFTFLLLKIGQDARTAVIIPLVLLAGVTVMVLPVAGGALMRRIGAAIGAFFAHGGGTRR
jgi:hypothetical protein